jgi:hypothetical protein
MAYGSYASYYKINYLTGEGMDFLIPYSSTESIVSPGFDNEGNMFVCPVTGANGAPRIFDSDWDLIGDALPNDSTGGYARCINVSPSGKDIYYTSFTSSYGIKKFHSDLGVDGTYNDQVDNLFPGLAIECLDWRPNSDQLWVGSRNDGGGYTKMSWYAIDTTNFTIVDSVHWQGNAGIAIPRGVAFSNDGNTLYITSYDDWAVDAIQKFTKNPNSVGWTYAGVIDGYTLSQNYPNPFNPVTEIKYSVGKPGHTQLKIYNTLGQEVATLVNGNVSVGTYTVQFDASNLSSGVYVYTLVSGNKKLSKRMTVLK